MKKYGIQMYSVRDAAEKDLRGALRTVAELGYSYVEFAGFYGHPAKEVKSWLKEYGLTCSGTHTCITLETLDDIIAYHQELECDNLIIPVAGWETEDKLKEYIPMFNKAQEKLAAAGIRLGYHNHSQEFLRTSYGVIPMEELLKRTKMELEIDTFWAFNAGVDPVEFMEAHKDRIRVIHLKDGIPSAPECKTYDHVYEGVQGKALGEGTAPIAQICDWANRNKVLMVVESEGLDPTGPEEIGRSIRYLRTLDRSGI